MVSIIISSSNKSRGICGALHMVGDEHMLKRVVKQMTCEVPTQEPCK
jgi:hypothetical protein